VLAAPSLIITELADPRDKAGARFVEIYSVDGAGQTINDTSLYLLRWTNGNAGKSITHQGYTLIRLIFGFTLLYNLADQIRPD